ncbi:MAG: diguanylate cyclase [Longimicrobiaceae bacterium]
MTLRPHDAALLANVIDALTGHIAVLDARGVIVAVNHAWRRFARQNGLPGEGFLVGASYLAACERAVRSGAGETATEALRGIRAVLARECESFTLEYPCHAPHEERWFILRATRAAAPGAEVVVCHDDITVRKRAEQQLDAAAHLLEEVLKTLPVGVWVLDAGGRIVFGNPAGERIWAGARYVGAEEFGEYRGWWVRTGEPIAAHEWAGARAISRGETSVDEEIEIECFDGTRKVMLHSAIPLIGDDAVTGAIVVNQDITARKREEEELARTHAALEAAHAELEAALAREWTLARTDPLTGASNRRHFLDLAAHELTVARRYGHPLSVVLFDVDHFKQVNDALDHQGGDETLRRVVEVAGRHLRDSDVLARYGGDEFIALLPHTSGAGACSVAERMRRDFAAATLPGGHDGLRPTISCGVAELRPEDGTVDPLVLRADRALYAAKRAGRNQTVVADGPATA